MQCSDPLHKIQFASLCDLCFSHIDCSQVFRSIPLLLRASCYLDILRSQHQSSLECWAVIHYKMFPLVPTLVAHGLGIFSTGSCSVPMLHTTFLHPFAEI